MQEACAFATDTGTPLGKAPADLVHVLARVAPGRRPRHQAMLRSVLRVVGMRTDALGGDAGVRVRNGAAQAAWSFRGLFNQAEVMSLLEGEPPYWRQVLDYCVDGCLQAVLDEYAHVLRGSSGPRGRAVPIDRVHQIAEEICEAMSLRTAQPGQSDLGLTECLGGRYGHRREAHALSSFALRFGDERTREWRDRDSRATPCGRRSTRRSGPWCRHHFDGQEGLDFHRYCRPVVHWDLADQSGRSGAARRSRSPFQGARRTEERRACPRNREHQERQHHGIRGSRCSRKRDGGAPMGPPM